MTTGCSAPRLVVSLFNLRVGGVGARILFLFYQKVNAVACQ